MTLRDGVERHIIQPIHALHALDAVQQALARNEDRAAQRGIIRTLITTPKPIVTPMNDEQPLGGIAQAPRTPWADFPDAVIHQSIPTVQGHPSHRSPEEAQRIPGASKNGQYHHHLSACANIFACVNALRNVTIAPRNTLRSFRACMIRPAPKRCRGGGTFRAICLSRTDQRSHVPTLSLLASIRDAAAGVCAPDHR